MIQAAILEPGEHDMGQAIRRVPLWILAFIACILLTVCPDGYAESAPPSEEAIPGKQVLICLSDDLPGNTPYSADDREYTNNIAVPVMSGIPGYLYRKTTMSQYWLFPVSYAQGTPTLYLSLEGIKSPTSVSINGALLTHDTPVAVPLKDETRLQVANARSRGIIILTFTTLPLVHLETPGNIYADHSAKCTITVTDPDYRQHGLSEATNVYDALVSRRGRSSAQFSAKHPYNFSLTKDGEKWDHSLLGLRSDSDWLLDSAYIDRSRMRNRVLMDVWDDIYRLPWDRTLSGATKGVYVELFIGDRYRGLYVLGEKQDRRQLGLAKPGDRWNSSFFRTGEKGSDKASPAGFVSTGRYKPGKEDPLTWYNVSLRFPQGDGVDYAACWNDFYDFTRLVIKGSSEEFAAKITQYADLDNLARYWLFANAVDLTDNMRKNMSFARLDDRDPRFNRYILLPWDMDSSLGRLYSSQKSRSQQTISNRLFDRLIAENPNNFRDTLRALWQEFRTGALSVDSIMAHFDHYYSKISECGADQREIGKYPTFTSYVTAKNSYKLNFEAELEYIRSYTEKRIVWLDGKVREICGSDPISDEQEIDKGR